MNHAEYIDHNLAKVEFYNDMTVLKFQEGTSRGMSINREQFEKIRAILKEGK